MFRQSSILVLMILAGCAGPPPVTDEEQSRSYTATEISVEPPIERISTAFVELGESGPPVMRVDPDFILQGWIVVAGCPPGVAMLLTNANGETYSDAGDRDGIALFIDVAIPLDRTFRLSSESLNVSFEIPYGPHGWTP